MAFSPDGDLNLANNVVMITGFDSLPLVGVCYEMVARYTGTYNFNLTSYGGSSGYRSRDVTLQQFRIVDGDAIQRRK